MGEGGLVMHPLAQKCGAQFLGGGGQNGQPKRKFGTKLVVTFLGNKMAKKVLMPTVIWFAWHDNPKIEPKTNSKTYQQ